MKLKFKILFLCTLLLMGFSINGQNIVVPQRTPEQEALKQTEKLQTELNLTPEQTKLIYEINLHYARQRQISNTRSEAMERIKNKNADIQRVLTEQQYTRLENKRIERSTVDIPNINRSQVNPVNSSSFRSSSQVQVNPTTRNNTSESNLRNSNAGSNTLNQSPALQPRQGVVNSTPPSEKRTINPASNPPTRSGAALRPTIRTPANNSPASRSQSNAPSGSRTQSSGNSNRR